MRIVAACAGLGALVGAVLVAALRWVAGSSVVAGVGSAGGGSGLPRRYADYLPTAVDGSTIDVARVLPVAVGAGLVAGLLVGTVLRVIPRPAGHGVRPVIGALAVTGPVVGLLVAVELHAYGHERLGPFALASNDFGWYAYSPSSTGIEGVFYSSVDVGTGHPSWWPLVVTGALVGLLAGALAATAWWTVRRRVSGA